MPEYEAGSDCSSKYTDCSECPKFLYRGRRSGRRAVYLRNSRAGGTECNVCFTNVEGGVKQVEVRGGILKGQAPAPFGQAVEVAVDDIGFFGKNLAVVALRQVLVEYLFYLLLPYFGASARILSIICVVVIF